MPGGPLSGMVISHREKFCKPVHIDLGKAVNFHTDLVWQVMVFGGHGAAKAHPIALNQDRTKNRSVSLERRAFVFEFCEQSIEEADCFVGVLPCDSRAEVAPGREMMVHARALYADFLRYLAEAQRVVAACHARRTSHYCEFCCF